MELAILSGSQISLSIIYDYQKSGKRELIRYETKPTNEIMKQWSLSTEIPEIYTTEDVLIY